MRRQWGKGLDIRQREFVGQYRSKVSPFSQRLGVTKRWAGEQGQWNGMTVGGGSLGPPFLRASLGSPCRWPHPDCFPWLCQIPLSLTGLMGRKYRRGRVGRETPPGLPLLWEIWLFDLKKQIVQILGRRNEGRKCRAPPSDGADYEEGGNMTAIKLQCTFTNSA